MICNIRGKASSNLFFLCSAISFFQNSFSVVMWVFSYSLMKVHWWSMMDIFFTNICSFPQCIFPTSINNLTILDTLFLVWDREWYFERLLNTHILTFILPLLGAMPGHHRLHGIIATDGDGILSRAADRGICSCIAEVAWISKVVRGTAVSQFWWSRDDHEAFGSTR